MKQLYPSVQALNPRLLVKKCLLVFLACFALHQAFAQGNAISLNGSSQYGSVTLSNLNGNAIAFEYTVEAWVRPNSTSGAMEIFSTRGTTDLSFDMKLQNGNMVHGDIGDGSTKWYTTSADATLNYKTGTWYHIAYTVSLTQNSYKIYINGGLAASGTIGSSIGTLPLLDANHPTGYIGSNAGTSEFFNGSIDEIRVYSSALTQAQVQADMASTSLNGVSPQLYFNFNQSATSFSDVSGSTRTGTETLFNTPSWVESYAMVIPASISAASNIGATSFTASWGAAAMGTVNNYVIDVSTDANFTSLVSASSPKTVSSATTSTTVSGLTAGTIYYYRVRADKTSVTGQGAYATSAAFTTTGKPSISSFSPVSGASGSSITITGTGFSTTPANNIVYIGGSKAIVIASTATSITATVPAGAVYGPITVTVNGLTAYSSGRFILTFNTGNTVINTNSFTAAASPGIITDASKIENADFDGDGFSDVLLSYGANKKFSVLRNVSAGGNVAYDTRIDFSTDAYSGMGGFARTAVADFDGDGKPDIVLIDAIRYLILKNTSSPGSISFSAGSVVTAPASGVLDIAAADMTGDGRPDVVLNYADKVMVLTNTSNGNAITFDGGTATTNTTSTFSSSDQTLAVADMNGDGLTDIITMSPNGAAISVLKNTSTLTAVSFASAVSFTTAALPLCIHLGDFDGDGNLDIACMFASNNTSFCNTVSMFRNASSGGTISFGAAQNFSVPASIPSGSNNINDFATGDINGDGKIDVLVIDRETVPGRVWVNSSTGSSIFSFSMPSGYGTTGFGGAAFIGDVDGDGIADLGISGSLPSAQLNVLRNVIGIPFISSFSGSNATDSTLTITGSNFTGTTAVTIGGVAAKSFSIISNTSITAVVGTNATGTSVTVTGSKGTASINGFVYIPSPTITAVSPTTLGPGVAVTITGSNFANIKSITFGGVAAASYTVNSSTQITATVGAGAPGNLVVTATGGIVTYSNFTYSGPVTAAVITSVSPLAAPAGATVTISGSGFGATTAENIVYFGTVKAVITAATNTSLSVTVPAGIAYQPVSVTVNSVTTYYPSPFIVTFSGAETTLKTTSLNGAYNTGIAAGSFAAYTAFGDFNNDGKPDMVNGNSTSQLSVYQNNSVKGSAVSFASAASFTTTQSITPVIADFDGDGKLDIAEMGATSFACLRNTSSNGTISFTQGEQNSTSQVISMATSADIDGDGRPDLVVRNGSNMSIYLNTTSGNTISFAAAVYFTLGSSPSGDNRSIATADVDGDGKPDVITFNGNNVVVFKNTSSAFSASLASGVTYATLSNPTFISAADLTGDGRPEIIVSYANSFFYSLYQNTGTGSGVSFAAKMDMSPNIGALRNVNAGDINGDGLVDLIVYGIGNSGTIQVNLNITDGTNIAFNPTSYAQLTDGGFELRDIDGDGRVDLCIRNNSDNFLVMRNRIASATITSFTPAAAAKDAAVTISGYNMATVNQVIFGGTPAKSFTVVDGSAITATVDAGTSGLIGVASSFGDTSFSASSFTFIDVPSITSFTPTTASATKTVVITGSNFSFASGVTFGGVPALSFTVNNNTTITAVVADGSASGNVAVITQAGTATKAGFTFAPTPIITLFSPALGPVGTSVTITGSNFKNTPAGNTVYVGGVKAVVTAASATSLTITIPAGASYRPISVTTSDSLTGYSKQPFVVTFANATAFGTKSFTPVSTFPVEAATYFAAAGDLDGDGLNDVAVSYGNSATPLVSVYRNTSTAGNVSFDNRLNLAAASGGTTFIFFSDIDGDEKQDIVSLNNSFTISVFKNTSTVGAPSFATRADFSTVSASAVTVADIDMDGRPDVVIGSNNKLTIYRNTTAGGVISFSAGTAITTTSPSPTFVTAGDVDLDGKPDLVVSCNLPDKLGVFKNASTPGTISLAAQVDLAARSNADNIVIGDLNNDGLPDIAVGYQFSTLQPVSVFLNTTGSGAISFAAKQDISSGGDSPFPTITDMDGDGLPDIASIVPTANGASRDFTILKNTTGASLSFQTAVVYGTQGLNKSGLVTDIDGDGKPDMVLANYNPNALKVFRNRINEPSITGFSPASAGTGATVTITGTNLQNVTGITFGSKAARSFAIVNNTTITAVVDTLSNSNAYVKVGYAISADSLNGFSYIGAPVITSFTPTTIGPSSLVTITGTGFSGTTSVTFGGVPATSFTANSTTITAVVANALSGNVTVTAPGGTGSQSGFVITAQTPPGNMLQFGVNSVNIPTGNLTVQGSYTVEAWVMSTGTSGQAESILSTRAGGANNTFDMKIANDGTLQADIGDGTNWLTTSANSSFTIARNRWYHIAYTVTPQGYTIYANGNPVDSGTFIGNPVLINSSYNKITIGILNQSTALEYFIGGIDEVKVWNTARTKAQVNSDMLSPVSNPRAETTLVAWYNFDEGVAGANNFVDAASYRYLADQSANNLTGQLVSFTLSGTSSNWLESYAMVIPTQPQAAAITATSFTASWVAPQVGTIDQYVLEVATNVNFSTIVQTLNPASGSTSANITGLTSGTQYWFRIRADKASVTGKSAYSNVVALKTLTVPTISSFTPLGTTQSGTVTINGTNFSDVTAVSFGGTAASFTIINATTITATVGAGTTGSVVVTAPGGTATKTGFVYIVPLTPPGNALNYSNGSEYVSIGTGSTVVSQNFTVEAWVRPQDVTKTMNIISTNIAAPNGFDMKLQGGNTITGDIGNGFNIVTSSTPTATFNYTAGKWCHIAFVVTTRNWFIYGNGVLLGSGGYVANPLFISSSRNIINIGHQTGSDNLVGSIDEVKVWNIARTQADIQADMANVISSPTSTSNLVLYLTFDQGTAGGNNSLVGSLFDQSTNHFTGTLNNFGLTGSSSNWVESYAAVIPAANAATNVTSNSFTANWTAPAAGTVENYVLEVANNAGFSPILNTYTPTATSQIVTGLTPGVNYWYRVRAEKASVTGQGYNSAVIPVTTAGIPAIISFTPQAMHGGQVIINGLNLTNASAVNFGGVPAIHFTVDNASTITAYVDNGASGIVSVTTPGGTATATGFTYLEQTASVTGDASVCRNGAQANFTFTASNGNAPFTFTYKIDGGAPQTIISSNNSISIAVTPGVAPATSIVCTLVSVDDNISYHTNINSNAVIAIKDATASTTSADVCSTDLPYSWNGGSYNTAGTYTAQLINAAGCDSTATLVLTVRQATTSTTLATICSTDPAYVWNGTSYNTSGTYIAHLINAAGCDSTATLILTVNQATSSTTPVTICSSQLPYVWNGNSYNAAGSYDVHLPNAAGCDSTATLVLTVNAVTTSRTDIARCANDVPYHWSVSGLDYTDAGIYTFTSTNAAGCDNIDSLVITVNQPTSSVTYATTCANLPYHWSIDGQDYTAEGTYTYTTTNAAGCDNIDSLVLTFTQPTSSTVDVTVCSGQLPYNWNGQDYGSTGTYTYVTTNAAGCDSTATLNLTVVPYFLTEESKALCSSQLQGYIWNGNDLTGATSGDYYYATTAASGCDSFVIFHLTVTSSATSTSMVKICQAQLPYIWNGTTYNTSGIYTVTLTNAAGCDSIATLVLTAHTDTTYVPVYIDASALPYTWNGHTYNSGGIYPVTLTSAAGCDSLAVLVLNINGQPAPQGFDYNTPNKFKKDRAITPLLPTTQEGAKTNFGPAVTDATGMTSDAAGNAYIVSSSADYVLKIYADGVTTTQIGSGITNATGVAVDLQGNIYVTEVSGTPVKKISPDGTITVMNVTGIYYASSIATDQQGNVFIGDYYSGIQKIAADGTQTLLYPDSNFPSYISTDFVGNVYVTDFVGGSITKVSADGSSATPVGPVIGSAGSVVADAFGNIYTPSSNNGLIQKVLPDGTATPVSNGYIQPGAIAPATPGYIYVLDKGNGQLDKMSIEGSAGSSYTISPALPAGLVFDAGTGAISGTPAVVSPLTTYTVSTSNTGGTTTAALDIKVEDLVAPPTALPGVFSYPTPNILAKGTAIANLSPTFVTPGTIKKIAGPTVYAPSGTAVDAAGNVYVVDIAYGSVFKIASDGTYIPMGNNLSYPIGIAVNTAGEVYVADAGDAVVKKISADGSTITPVTGSYATPVGVVADAVGNIYVADGSPFITEIAADGTNSTFWTDNSYNGITNITIDGSDNIYVANYSGSVTKITGGTGTIIGTIPGGNSAGIATDAAGNVYALNANTPGNCMVYKMEPDGTISTVALGLDNQFGVASDASGNLYLGNVVNGISQVDKIFGESGPVSSYDITPALPQGLAFNASTGVISGTPLQANPQIMYTVTAANANGNSSAQLAITVTDKAGQTFGYNTPNVYVKNAAIQPLAPVYAPNLPVKAGTITTLPGTFSNPTGLAFDANGNLYVSNTDNYEVDRINKDGTVDLVTYSGLVGPQGMAIDAAGYIYVVNGYTKNSPLIKMDANGNVSTIGRKLNYPGGVALDAAGNIYIAEWGAKQVIKMSPDGNTVTVLASSFAFNGPNGIAVDAAGNVFVADYDGKKVVKIDINDVATMLAPSHNFGGPADVKLDSKGNVYVTDQPNNEVDKIAPDGTVTPVGSGFNAPGGLTLDADGNIYVSDSNNGVVKKVTGNADDYSNFTITPALPGGLAIDTATGIISGTPAVTSPTKKYTISVRKADSVITTNTVITVNADVNTIVNICASDAGTMLPYYWNGQYYNTTGNYTAVLTNAAGQDSIVTLHLNILMGPTATLSASGNKDSVCYGAQRTITVRPVGAVNAYQYSLDGSIYQVSNNFLVKAGTYNAKVVDVNGCYAATNDVTIVQPAAKVKVASMQVNSSGITVTATGGFGSYVYNVNGGAFQPSNTIAGPLNLSDVITVKDIAGCIATATVQLPIATVTASGSKDSVCYGAQRTISAKVTGGTSPYQYSLDGGAYQSSNSFLAKAGIHTITVKDAAGYIFAGNSITILQPAVKLTVPSIQIVGSNVTVTAAGGFGNYMYSVNGGAYQPYNTFTAAINDVVTVKDIAGCVATATVQLPAATLAVAGNKDTVCYGAQRTITVAAKGGVQPYQYSFDGGAYQTGNTLLATAGTHTATVKDVTGYTFTTNSVTIVQAAAKLSVTSAQVNVSCNGSSDGSITITAIGGFAGYTYTINNGSFGSSNLFSNLSAGAYAIYAKDITGCSVTKNVTITQPATPCQSLGATPTPPSFAKTNVTDELKIKVYPNPAVTEFNLEVVSGDIKNVVELRVMDMLGKTVYKTRGSVYDMFRFGRTFAGGMYIAEVLNGNNVQRIKLVKGN